MKKMFLRLRPFIGLVICSGLFIIGNSLANLQMPALLADIVNNGVAMGDSDYVTHTGIRMLGVAFFAVCCSLGTTYCSSRIATGFSSRLRDELFYKVQSFSEGEVDRFGTASLITRSINDVSQIQHFLMMLIRNMLSAPITAIGGVYLAFSCNAQLAMIVFAAMPLIVLIVVGISRFSIPLTCVMQEKLDQVNLVLREKLRGVRVIRAFGTEEYEEQRFARANEDLTGVSIRMQRTMSAMSPLVMIVLNGATVFLIYVGGVKVNNGLMPYGDIMAVVEYVMQILMSMMMISMIFIRIPRAVASAGRINAILDCDTAIEGGTVIDSGETRGRLEFRNVTFSYENADEPAVKNISFTAEKGQTVAIIGSTGSGKTTLLNLIPRFYDAQEGQILIDGIDHREYDLKALRDKIGLRLRRQCCLPAVWQTTSPMVWTMPPGSRWNTPPGSPRRRSLYSIRSADTIPPSSRVDRTSRADRSSGSPLPVPLSGVRSSICLMTASRRWTSAPIWNCAGHWQRKPKTVQS